MSNGKSKLSVLYLEDKLEDFELVKWELREVATVELAKDKNSFEALINQKHFDVVLVDLALPAFSGEEAIAMLRDKDVPIILITGSTDHRTASRYLRSGAVDYFLKDSLVKDNLARLSDAVIRAHENHNLRKQSLRDNRIELVGHMQAGFNHDLRNILQVFISGVEVLRQILTDLFPVLPQNISRVLDAMHSTGCRGADMSNQITAFIRGTNGNIQKIVKPEYVLTELGKMVRESFPQNIRISIHTVPGTSSVKCDVTQIIQLLMNLTVNAKDAMSPFGGDLRITAQNEMLNEPEVHPNLKGAFVVFQVRDTGNGILAEHLDKIWEPFFTTKPVGLGTGLGLPMARKIAQEHGGEIDVKTGIGGTSFYVYLPVAIEETRAEKVTRMEKFDGKGKTILCVDDEAHMRMLIEMFLTDANYKALIAGSAMEALSLFRSNQTIDLLLTDCGMNVMSGQELAIALRGQSYELPIVFMTGHSDADQFDPAPDSILRKPFSRDQLLKALQDVLTSVAGSVETQPT